MLRAWKLCSYCVKITLSQSIRHTSTLLNLILELSSDKSSAKASCLNKGLPHNLFLYFIYMPTLTYLYVSCLWTKDVDLVHQGQFLTLHFQIWTNSIGLIMKIDSIPFKIFQKGAYCWLCFLHVIVSQYAKIVAFISKGVRNAQNSRLFTVPYFSKIIERSALRAAILDECQN